MLKDVDIAFLWKKNYLKSYLKSLEKFNNLTNKFCKFKIILISFHSHEKYTYCFYTHVFFLCALTGSCLELKPICNLSLFRFANKLGTPVALGKKTKSFKVRHRVEFLGFLFHISRRCQLYFNYIGYRKNSHATAPTYSSL